MSGAAKVIVANEVFVGHVEIEGDLIHGRDLRLKVRAGEFRPAGDRTWTMATVLELRWNDPEALPA